ncbi:MAG: bifunctional glutamate N-acetyltransferase/amino-acid acetyltransferase ArgJ [Actinomycetota bacterium]
MSVTFPAGFRAAGVVAGFKPSGAPDLGLLVADGSASAAGVFTTNAFRAAPVELCARRLADGTTSAVLVNAGQANAATGETGTRDALRSTEEVAEALGVDASAVLACSTGVIGEPLHMDELLTGVPAVVRVLSTDGGPEFAQAIMTTDTVSKQATAQAGRYRVGGAAKGVGMIAPDLATMLVFVTTDASVPPAAVHELATTVLEPAFESLSVDASTSTNDTVLLLASGAAGGDAVTPSSTAWSEVSSAIEAVASSLLDQLAADAEGATHVLLVEISGAATTGQARIAAKAVADSPLVKTAAFGGDPNPGRILQAVGAAGIQMDPARVDVAIGEVPVIRAGVVEPAYFAPGGDEQARAAMKEPQIAYRIRLGDGPGTSRVLGCDLSHDYVRINGEYTT